MDDAKIRARIRHMIETGALPCESSELWGGPGQGDACAACGEVISVHDTEFELSLTAGRRVLHRWCYMLWRAECDALKPA